MGKVIDVMAISLSTTHALRGTETHSYSAVWTPTRICLRTIYALWALKHVYAMN